MKNTRHAYRHETYCPKIQTRFYHFCYCIVALIIIAKTSDAERVFSEVGWSKSLCEDLGYENEFDFCGEIVFCHNENVQENYRRHNLRRGRRLNKYDEEEYDEDKEEYDEDEKEYDEDEEEYDEDEERDGAGDRGVSNNAEFGWKLAGDGNNCSWPGPLIRMQRGNTYGLMVRGSGDEDIKTNLHTHGLHVAGHGNGDDIARYVSGNDVIIYQMNIEEHHMGGTFWYHSHFHGETATQAKGGAFGMLIIEDEGKDVEINDAKVVQFLSSKDHELLLVAANREDSWIANGVTSGNTETYSLDPETWYRLRILTVNLNEHNSRQTITIGDESCSVHALAHDGIFRFKVPATKSKNDYNLSVSSRLDVAIKCGADSEIKINGETVATIEVAGAAKSNSNSASPWNGGIEGQSWSSRRPPYLMDLRGLPAEDSYKVKVGETNINDQQYHPTEPLCHDDEDFKYGTIQEWEIHSTSHPFHVHLYPMQIVSGKCGKDYEVGEYYDTISPATSKCTVRMNFVDIGGKTVLHCHIYRHGDQGAMGFINVVDAPNKLSDEPRVHKCADPPCDVPSVPKLCSDLN